MLTMPVAGFLPWKGSCGSRHQTERLLGLLELGHQ